MSSYESPVCMYKQVFMSAMRTMNGRNQDAVWASRHDCALFSRRHPPPPFATSTCRTSSKFLVFSCPVPDYLVMLYIVGRSIMRWAQSNSDSEGTIRGPVRTFVYDSCAEV